MENRLGVVLKTEENLFLNEAKLQNVNVEN